MKWKLSIIASVPFGSVLGSMFVFRASSLRSRAAKRLGLDCRTLPVPIGADICSGGPCAMCLRATAAFTRGTVAFKQDNPMSKLEVPDGKSEA